MVRQAHHERVEIVGSVRPELVEGLRMTGRECTLTPATGLRVSAGGGRQTTFWWGHPVVGSLSAVGATKSELLVAHRRVYPLPDPDPAYRKPLRYVRDGIAVVAPCPLDSVTNRLKVHI